MNQTKSSFSNDTVSYMSNSFNMNIINRILVVLHEKGQTNRTNLAGMAGLNYNQCVKYVNLLQLLGWVRFAFDDGHQIIIEEKGIEIIKKLNNSL